MIDWNKKVVDINGRVGVRRGILEQGNYKNIVEIINIDMYEREIPFIYYCNDEGFVLNSRNQYFKNELTKHVAWGFIGGGGVNIKFVSDLYATKEAAEDASRNYVFYSPSSPPPIAKIEWEE